MRRTPAVEVVAGGGGTLRRFGEQSEPEARRAESREGSPPRDGPTAARRGALDAGLRICASYAYA